MDGSADGFDEFVVARAAALLRFAYVLTQDGGRAEDLVQVALVKAHRRWRSRAFQHFCVGAWPLGGSADAQPAREHDIELVQRESPVRVALVRRCLGSGHVQVAAAQVEQLDRGFVGRAVPAGLGDLAERRRGNRSTGHPKLEDTGQRSGDWALQGRAGSPR